MDLQKERSLSRCPEWYLQPQHDFNQGAWLARISHCHLKVRLEARHCRMHFHTWPSRCFIHWPCLFYSTKICSRLCQSRVHTSLKAGAEHGLGIAKHFRTYHMHAHIYADVWTWHWFGPARFSSVSRAHVDKVVLWDILHGLRGYDLRTFSKGFYRANLLEVSGRHVRPDSSHTRSTAAPFEPNVVTSASVQSFRTRCTNVECKVCSGRSEVHSFGNWSPSASYSWRACGPQSSATYLLRVAACHLPRPVDPSRRTLGADRLVGS